MDKKELNYKSINSLQIIFVQFYLFSPASISISNDIIRKHTYKQFPLSFNSKYFISHSRKHIEKVICTFKICIFFRLTPFPPSFALRLNIQNSKFIISNVICSNLTFSNLLIQITEFHFK